jgi:hypothetical protein
MRWAWVLLPALLQQEKVKIELRAQKGQSAAVETSEVLRATFEVETDRGSARVEKTLRVSRKHDDRVLAVDDAGRAAKVERTFREYTVEEYDDPKKRPPPRKSPLDGRRIVLMRKGDQTVYEGADDVADAELRRDRLRPDPLLASLPKEAVAVGSSWKVEGQAYLDALNADKGGTTWATAAITAHLTSVNRGRAHISYAIKLRGATDRKEETAFDASGEHVIELEAKRVLSFTLNSSFTVQSGGRRICLGSVTTAASWSYGK